MTSTSKSSEQNAGGNSSLALTISKRKWCCRRRFDSSDPIAVITAFRNWNFENRNSPIFASRGSFNLRQSTLIQFNVDASHIEIRIFPSRDQFDSDVQFSLLSTIWRRWGVRRMATLLRRFELRSQVHSSAAIDHLSDHSNAFAMAMRR